MRQTDTRGFLVRVVKGHARRPMASALRACLAPAALIYGGAAALRRRAYSAGLLSSVELGVPVVSVGNITAGGTGKTPMVEWIIRRLCRWGRKPAILSRGYGASGDSKKNDEALLLERRIPAIPHFLCADRVSAGRRAVAAGADCLVLDDGFQHLRVKRRLNVLLLDVLDPFGGGWVLPAGTLREPLSSLRAADAIVLTRVNAVSKDEMASIKSRLDSIAPGRPVFMTEHRPETVTTLDGSLIETPAALSGRKVALVCGIGNPEGFLRTVQSLGANVVSTRFFPDHHPYAAKDLADLVEDLPKSDAECILVTEKDAVKLAGLSGAAAAPVRVLNVQLAFTAGEDHFEQRLKDALC